MASWRWSAWPQSLLDREHGVREDQGDSLTEMKMERLLEVLKLMASDYVVQKAALPSFVVVPDEIALLFEDEFSVASASGGSIGAHDPQIGQELRLLNDSLEHMSDDKELWTDAALQSSSEWQGIRQRASRVLAMMGEELRPPRLEWATYIEGKRRE